MEVVLSPGRFGDDTAGVPFQKEEIREWSQVDRLTGMLERARVETGRWQTSNREAAKSYGKVIDSRERNSADGSVVQRARRQVEIFQSQGRGRSVQVVRASHWSSSRVTDASSTNSAKLPILTKEGEEAEKFVNSSILDKSDNCFSRQEAIRARLSTLIGNFGNPISSTVPPRRIDSKYSSRAGILNNTRRSNSNEDLAILSRVKNDIVDISLLKNCSNVEEAKNINVIVSVPEKNDRKFFVSSGDEEKMCMKNLPIFSRKDDSDRRKKSAIQLLPSSRSNRTVVNLTSDAIMTREDFRDCEKLSLNGWTKVPKILNESEKFTRQIESFEAQKERGKIQKRVGFSKTEIHFAADSGKVNIVETDEKPPPTNKFRRKRRINGGNTGNEKNLSINDTPVYATRNDEISVESTNRCLDNEEKMRKDRQRGHTTTVKLGSEILKNNDTANEEIEKIESSEMEKVSSPPINSRNETSAAAAMENYDVVCKDSDNNRVVSKVVTTHEPIIARVENDNFRKITKKPMIKKKSSKIMEIPMKKKSQIEHTYVNVFDKSERAPIYENYKICDINNSRKIDKISMADSMEKKESKSTMERGVRVESLNFEKIKIDENKLIKIPELSLAKTKIDKKLRTKRRDEKSIVIGEKITGDLSSSNSTNSPATSRLRTGKILKNSTTSGISAKCQNSVLSMEREKLDNSTRQTIGPMREISTTRTRKSENGKKPMEVVYQTAVYNMKNEKLSKPQQRGKESRGPRYINELICGAKTKKPSDSKSKTSSTVQHSASNKCASQTVRHWK